MLFTKQEFQKHIEAITLMFPHSLIAVTLSKTEKQYNTGHRGIGIILILT